MRFLWSGDELIEAAERQNMGIAPATASAIRRSSLPADQANPGVRSNSAAARCPDPDKATRVPTAGAGSLSRVRLPLRFSRARSAGEFPAGGETAGFVDRASDGFSVLQPDIRCVGRTDCRCTRSRSNHRKSKQYCFKRFHHETPSCLIASRQSLFISITPGIRQKDLRGSSRSGHARENG